MTEPRHQAAVDKYGQYVEIKPIIVRDEPDAHIVALKVNQQSFRLDCSQENLEHAEWMRDMLCVAIAVIVEEAKPVRVTVGDET